MKFPKRVCGTKTCPICKKEVSTKLFPSNHKNCVDCRNEIKNNYLYKKNPTRKEVVYEKLTRAAAFAYIRWHARSVVLKDVEKKCSKCGYTNHVEACHLKPIADFIDDSTLSEINDVSNLMFLCPNHHWEHDFMKVVGQEGTAPSSIS